MLVIKILEVKWVSYLWLSKINFIGGGIFLYLLVAFYFVFNHNLTNQLL